MSNISLCRVCLVSNTKMHHIANTRYQEIFEKLSTKLCTEDRRPKTICFICYSQLQRCCQFMDMSQKAEEILTQFFHSGIELSDDTCTILNRKFVNKYSCTPLQILYINAVEGCDANVEIKQEPISIPNLKVEDNNDNDEPNTSRDKADTITVKEENVSECEGDIDNDQLIDAEEVTVKEENIKQEFMEYECDLEAEYKVEGPSEKKYYKEVGITHPTPESSKHACKYCNKSYKQKCHLNRHLKNHKAREYTCEMCGKMFAQKSSLKKHYLHHTGEKPFACSLCPARCTQQIDLKRHMRTHTGQKPFTCDICKQTFSRKNNMKLHILTHSDSKPFVCHICNSTFSRRYDLNRHKKRKHIGEKPYTCDVCEFRSVNASYVKTHMENMHLKERGVKQFACDKCDFKCANARYLNVHVQKKHLNSELPLKISESK